jgi:DNA-binding response OmpR family regulator
MRVLVVDDYIDTADFQRQLLKLDGHECRVAHSGAHALALVESWCPEVVLLDLALPDLSGWDVAKRIQAACKEPPPAIVVVSAFEPDPEMLRVTGLRWYLMKPVDTEVLRTLLRRLEDEAQREDPSPLPAL